MYIDCLYVLNTDAVVVQRGPCLPVARPGSETKTYYGIDVAQLVDMGRLETCDADST